MSWNDYAMVITGISIAAFRVGGGILILLMAVDMLHARRSRSSHTAEENQEAVDRDSVAVVPLAIPLLAGPGAISTVILDAHTLSAWSQRLILSAIILGAAFTIWLSLTLAAPITERLGKTGNNILSRLMGLILAAIAVEFIVNGMMTLLGLPG